MVSEKFRRQLRACARKWREEGLISDAQYQQLSERYEFNTIDAIARNRFIAILIGLGALLLGIGVITLVRANWQVWSRELRISLLLGLFVTLNVSGFYLWRPPVSGSLPIGGWQQRLGQGLLFLGSLILGTNMALIGQMFYIRGSQPEFFITWGLGVLVMSYSLRVTSLGLLASIAIAGSYWPGLAEVSSMEDFSWVRPIIEHMPVVAGFVLLPLAYWCRSRLIFLLSGMTLMVSLEVNLWVGLSILNAPTHCILAIAYALPPTLLWSYDDERWHLTSVFAPSEETSQFQPIARAVALVFLAITFYLMSFHWFWSSSTLSDVVDSFPAEEIDVRQGLLYVLDVLIVLGSWVALEWGTKAQDPGPRIGFASSTLYTNAIAVSIAIASGVLFWHFGIASLPVAGPFTLNVLLFLLGYGLMRQGFALGRRDIFWWGIILLAIQLLTRVLEYDMSLAFKALLFLLWGGAVITVGLWFERYISTLSDSE